MGVPSRAPTLARERSASERARLPSWLPVAALLVLTALGAALRLDVADQSVFADELSTYWIVSTHGLGGVISTVHGDAEITPPLFFMAAWAATRIDLTPELLRLPSLVAGIATIPLTYLIGVRALSRAAGLVAAALTTLSPFMIYYSAEARGYALAIALVALSTLAMLVALDDERRRWWVLYAAATCAAVYTHYTAVFALGAQLLWLLWTHPDARRPALVATAGAAAAFLPWLSGLRADFDSPTTDILDSLSPFTFETARTSLEHWSIGTPLLFTPDASLRELPGTVALALLALGVATAIAGVVTARRRARRPWAVQSGVVLVVLLALATPVGEALASAVGTNLLTTRNLAVSWPALALSLAALLTAPGRWLSYAATGLVLACFALSAAKMLEARYERPDYAAAATLVDSEATRNDVVVDAAASLVTPGPFTGLDVELDRPHRIFRVGVPQQRTHPYTIGDPIFPAEDVVRQAAAAARGGRLFLVVGDAPIASAGRTRLPFAEPLIQALPARYERVHTRSYPGSLRLAVLVYADRRAGLR